MGHEDTFDNVNFLKLSEVTLAKWGVREESFPMLERLEMWKFHKLEEIPPIFGDIGSLKIINIWQSPQLEDSALKIKQYTEDMMGGDEIHIHGPIT
ncbi:hypothetical protein R3W88_014734 [Solanum pinnatisectum]|uniref:Disease resistance protein n=1 Tax=Solanum pinnatisectum TaxID=50273 RepID=A0AAV9KSH3_9SOLN|nr:hypothetical protein R3W88_014734 [Solanum pinnatisectum]